MPTQVAISGNRVYVANAKGRGTGPNPRRVILELGEVSMLHRGSVSTFTLPDTEEILRLTGDVFSYAGLVPYMHDPPPPPAAIRHVVLIVKEGRAFDEVMGDVVRTGDDRAGNDRAEKRDVLSYPRMARFGLEGFADGGRKQFSVKDAQITPNQHEIARRWAFSDNFYADGETKLESEIWLNGSFPDQAMETDILASRDVPAATALWDHLKAGGVKFKNFDALDSEAGSSAILSDQRRADEVIGEIERRYGGGGEPFPQFVRIRLAGDRGGDPRPMDGYPYESSFIEDNDFAAGRILDYLSHSPWWRNMTVFITESDTEGSLDHLDSHRTLLFAAGPYVKRDYVSHTNTSFPGLLRTIFELLGQPPLNLMDATAASLRDVFTGEPNFEPFAALPPDRRIFDPPKPPESRN